MNPELLLAHFEPISDTPDAIPRLRRFVLDLAVHGKLVEQEPKDEPAAVLLKRIEAKKAEIACDVARKEKPLPLLTENELPFRIPTSWRWSQLAEVGLINPRNIADDAALSSFVPMTLISSEYGVTHTHEVKHWAEIKTGFTHFAEGDVALAKITPCFENGKSTIFRGLTGGVGAGTTELHVVRPVIVSAEYVLIFLKSPHFIESGIPRMTGTAGQKRVPTTYFANSPFPLPPLAEQHRIVGKVAELMRLCDSLEVSQGEQEHRRDALVAASLHHLTNAADTKTLRSQANFYLDHLFELTRKNQHIEALRQAILDLAVRGFLVHESVERCPRQQVSVLQDFDTNLPAHWSVLPLTEVSSSIVDCPHSTPKWTAEGKICVRTNQFRPGKLDLSDVRFVSESTYLERIQRLEPAENDILYSREGGILGVACRVPSNTQLCLGQRMMLIRAGATIDASFLEMVLNSPFITRIALAKTTGGAAPRINVATVKAYPIPLPPLGEQRSIVAKMNALMGLCAQLESRLMTAETESRRLLEAVLHRALESPAIHATTARSA